MSPCTIAFPNEQTSPSEKSLCKKRRQTPFLEAPDVEVDLVGELVLKEVPLVLRAVLPFGAGVHHGHVVDCVQPAV